MFLATFSRPWQRFQALGCLVVTVWSLTTTGLAFLVIGRTLGIRMSAEEEAEGADWAEHRIPQPKDPAKNVQEVSRHQLKGL